ncbi:alpha/beta fold hydrolase [Variovorax sp. GT1P44]|uniref:alpha/beta fold hydrolase n=1 Tax=Variovorax sp. GT1P44 TaxID=3443742 RepID=UPI003F4526A6
MNCSEFAAGKAAVIEHVGPAPRIAIERQGHGPLVVFLHGIGGNRANWRDQMAAFAGEFSAVAWDARGYGDSDDYEGALHFEDFSTDLLRVMAHCGARRAHLVGLSMGGRIALDFYGRHPEHVASLVLADTSVAMPAGPDREAHVSAILADRQRPLLGGKTPAEIAPALARGLASSRISPERLAMLQQSVAELHKDSYLKTLEAVTRYEGFPPLGSVHVPCLVVVGSEDRIAPVDVARLTAAAIPGARLEIIGDAGHVSNLEEPAAFNAAVLNFLRGVETAGRHA